MDSHLEAQYEEKMSMSAQQAQEDDYDDPNYETCSLCTTLVPWSELTTVDEGNICPDCHEEHAYDEHGTSRAEK